MTMSPSVVKPRYLDLDTSDALLSAGKDPRLIRYGGANLGMPLELLEPEGPLIVPTTCFFVRCNGPVPVLDPNRWTLSICGRVARALTLRLRDLTAMPQRSVTAFLECAGNGRSRFDPLPAGTPWANDAAGCAEWEGVSLAMVLALAGVNDEAVDVVSQGADSPMMRRGLPLAVARDPDTLLVLRMNGEPLPIAHGGPLRLLVPGWAGIASTKWLIGLEVLTEAFAGYWNTDNYVYSDEEGTPLRPVREMGIKSVISAPNEGDVLSAGPARVSGYAWSGYGAISSVEVSVNDGRSWHPARLEQCGRRSWVRFHLAWQASPGRHAIMARATDERGLRQPRRAAWNSKGYGQNGVHRVAVTFAPPAGAQPANP